LTRKVYAHGRETHVESSDERRTFGVGFEGEDENVAGTEIIVSEEDMVVEVWFCEDLDWKRRKVNSVSVRREEKEEISERSTHVPAAADECASVKGPEIDRRGP